MPSHDPYKDPAFSDLAEEQMVGIPLDLAAWSPRTRAKLLSSLTGRTRRWAGAIVRSPRSIPVRPHPRRLNAIELAQLQPVVADEPSVYRQALDLRHIHGHVQSPHFAQELSHSAANAFNRLEYCG